jgi:hypothetical protein
MLIRPTSVVLSLTSSLVLRPTVRYNAHHLTHPLVDVQQRLVAHEQRPHQLQCRYFQGEVEWRDHGCLYARAIMWQVNGFQRQPLTRRMRHLTQTETVDKLNDGATQSNTYATSTILFRVQHNAFECLSSDCRTQPWSADDSHIHTHTRTEEAHLQAQTANEAQH